MSVVKRGLRYLGMGLFAVGIVATVAVADKDGADKTVLAIEDLIHEMKTAEEINNLNQKDFQNDWKVAQKQFDHSARIKE